ncbi:hypothetical protein EJB05_14699, partial [Eragrostis curvula]
MDRPEKRSVAGLPDDPLVEILSRVSVKDLHRSKCVSKGWRDLIADPLHCKKLPQTLEGFFHGSDGRYVDLMKRSVPLVDPTFSFLTSNKLLSNIETLRLLHSCNGLLLFLGHHCNPDTFGYVVCNPATEQLVAVSPSPFKESKDGGWAANNIFLMFDPAVSSHFHLIQFWSKIKLGIIAVHTFSSATGVWSDRASEWRAGEEGGGWAQWGMSADMRCWIGTTVFNNMLHFMVRRFGIVRDSHDMIVAVDGEGKTCRVIPWRENSAYPTFVGQSQGRLFCFSVKLTEMSELSIWALDDYGTEEWSLKHRVSFLKLFGKVSCRECDYTVATIHPDRNLIFLFEFCNRKLISYDMDSKEVHALCNLGLMYESITPYVPFFSELPMLTNKN